MCYKGIIVTKTKRSNKMKKVLVTGADGFLASRFVDYYQAEFDILATNRHQLDIANEHEVYQLFKNNNFDLVFHSAAISDMGRCLESPQLAHEVNTLATSYLAKGCARNGAKLIFTSTDQVYNGTDESGPYGEDVALTPIPVYAQSKLNAENLIKQELEEFYNLRLTWLFALPEAGKRVNPNIIMNLIQAIKQQKQLSLAGDDLRGMTYAYDVIKNIKPLLDIPFGDYNFGGENNQSTYDIGVELLSLIDPTLHPEKIFIKDFNRFNGKPRDLRISTEKLKRNGIYIPSTREGIERCLIDGKAKDADIIKNLLKDSIF